jgi:hypothetical protein
VGTRKGAHHSATRRLRSSAYVARSRGAGGRARGSTQLQKSTSGTRPGNPRRKSVRLSDLARSKRVKACRKPGLGGQAESTGGGLASTPKRQQGSSANEDSSVEDVPSSESGGIGLSSVERALGSAPRVSITAIERRAARQGTSEVPFATSREAEKATHAASRTRSSHGSIGDGERGFSWRERCQTRRHSDRRCPRGHSMPSCK